MQPPSAGDGPTAGGSRLAPGQRLGGGGLLEVRRGVTDRLRPYVGPLAILAVQQVLFPVPAGALLQGVVLGLLTALVVVGMFLVHRAGRVLNFAQGELGVLPAVFAVMLIIESGLPWLLGLVAGLVAAVVLGVASEFLIIRRFSRSPRLVLTVATLGLGQVLSWAALSIPRWWDARVSSQRIDSPLDIRFEVGSFLFNDNHLLVLVVAPAVITGVGLLLRYTRIGILIRAAADSPDRALLLGIPVLRIQSIVWGLATLLAFLAIFLRTGIQGLPVGATLGFGLLLRSLAALMVGRMDSLSTVTAAAVTLGVLQQAVDWNVDSPQIGLAVVAGVALAALLLGGVTDTGGIRGAESWRAVGDPRPLAPVLAAMPRVRALRLAVPALVLLLALVAPLRLGVQDSFRAGVLFILTVVGLSLVVLSGWAGQISLGQGGFVAIGAVVGSRLTLAWNMDLVPATLVAGLVGAAVAVLVGLPALRLSGIHLAVATLAFSVGVTSWAFNDGALDLAPTGRIARLPLLGRVDWSSTTAAYYVALVGLVLALLAVRGIRYSRTGRVLLALRDNETALAAYGVGVTRAKLTAFAISGFLAAYAGSLYVHHQQAFAVDGLGYTTASSISFFVGAIVGGLGSMLGAVLGTLYWLGGSWFLSGSWRLLATGAGGLIMLLVAPGGLAGLLYDLRDMVLARLVPGPVGPEELPPAPTGPGETSP